MIVKNTKRDKNTVTFDVELDSAEFEKHVSDAYRRNRGRIMVPGFRKGKAPRMVIEGMYGADVFHEEALENAANEAFAYGAEQEKLRTVGRPEMTDGHVTEEKGAALSFRTEVWPEVKLGQYKGLEAEKASAEVTDEELTQEVERLRRQNARLVTVDRGAVSGDTVVIDYAGTKDGVPFDGGSAQGYSLVLGSDSFIPGFEEKLIGVSAGEERDLSLTFPQEYHAEELAGQDVVFHVKCHEVKLEELPEADDEFAKDNGFDTLEELKADFRRRRGEEKENAAQNAFTDALVDQAAENMTVELSQAMVEDRMDGIMRDYAQYLGGQGIRFEDYIRMMGGDLQTFRESTRGTAEKQARTELLLTAVAEAEKLELTDADYAAEYERMARNYGMKPEDVEKAVSREVLRDDLIRRKAVEFIAENGKAVAPKAKKAVRKPTAKTADAPKAEKKPAVKKTAKAADAPKAEEAPKAEKKPAAKKTAKTEEAPKEEKKPAARKTAKKPQ